VIVHLDRNLVRRPVFDRTGDSAPGILVVDKRLTNVGILVVDKMYFNILVEMRNDSDLLLKATLSCQPGHLRKDESESWV